MEGVLLNVLRKALGAGNGPVEIHDPSMNKVYVIAAKHDMHSDESSIDPELIASIQNGIDDMQVGRGRPLAEAANDIRETLKNNPDA